MRLERQPVAIIGAAVRAPGGIDTLASFTQLLREGRNTIGDLATYRMGPFADAWSTTQRRGGFLEHVFDFDARFFNMSPREARVVDPQQRLLLEVAWEAFEDASTTPASVGERTGVFVGITGQDYRRWFAGEPTAHWTAGNGLSFASGRIAHLLGLSGPAVSIDTACSSSLVAVHNGWRALAGGDCDVALVAGVNLILAPWTTQALERTGALSPNGQSRPFDVQANGYVRAEGCAAVVLKRLDEALRDHDQIHGVIDAVGMNQDGAGSAFSAPNGAAQADVLASTLAISNSSPEEVGFHEAHGTGTQLGDRVELTAIRDAFAGKSAVYVGSVKALIGHAEAASGLLGLLKAMLAIKHQEVFPQPNLTALREDVPLAGTGIQFAHELTRWPAEAGRRATVSSFGMSGTNVVALLSPPPTRPQNSPDPSEVSTGILLSAASPPALREIASRYARWLRNGGAVADLATATSFGRTRLAQTCWVPSASAAEVAVRLDDIAAGSEYDRAADSERHSTVPASARRRQVLASVPTYPWQRETHVIWSPGG